MKWLCDLAVCLFALALIAAALVYPFRSKLANDVVKKAAMLALGILVVPPLVVQLMQQSDALTLFFAFVLISTAAYFIREARKPDRAALPGQHRPGGGERKPVLPRSGGGES